MNPRMYLSALVCVAVIRTVMTAPTKVTKKEKNASSQSSSSSTALSMLAFQPARGCTIRKETSTRGTTTSYHLVGTVGRKATVLFSDRPAREAKNVFTRAFVDNFDAIFVSSKPNTVISLANEEDDPLIVVITGAKILRTNEEDGSLVLEYDIEQQGTQDEVSSIDQFVEYDRQHCSIFVDDYAADAAPEYNPATDFCYFKQTFNPFAVHYCWFSGTYFYAGNQARVGTLWNNKAPANGEYWRLTSKHCDNNCGPMCRDIWKYRANTSDNCWTDKTYAGKYCWTTTKFSPYPEWQWERSYDNGDNNCGQLCTIINEYTCADAEGNYDPYKCGSVSF